MNYRIRFTRQAARDIRKLTPKLQGKLKEILRTYFNESELRDLCFEMAIVYEDVPGQALIDKARELVLYCERIGRVDELVTACRARRPNAPW